MNELIENNLIEHLESIMLSTSINDAMGFFKQAIQTACKAQRNACLREWTNTHFDYEIGCNILTAEIRKEDYE